MVDVVSLFVMQRAKVRAGLEPWGLSAIPECVMALLVIEYGAECINSSMMGKTSRKYVISG